jgi:hypothetical protein
MKNRSFNIIWKPRGGGKRDSQLLFVRLIHLGILTKPRDTILYVDADTSFRPVDFGKLYNGLMRDPKVPLRISFFILLDVVLYFLFQRPCGLDF